MPSAPTARRSRWRHAWLPLLLLGAACASPDDRSTGAGSAPLELLELPGPADRAVPVELGGLIDKVDPSRDGWESEVWSGRVGERLHELEALLGDRGAVTPERLAPLLADGFRTGALRPAEPRVDFRDGDITVRREATGGAETTAKPGAGADGLSTALAALFAPYAPGAPLEIHFKLTGIRVDGGTLDTDVDFEASGAAPGGRLQQNAVWRMRWTAPGGDGPPLLSGIASEGYEEVEIAAAGPLFADVTGSVLGGNDAYRTQLLLGQDHWGATLDVALGPQLLGHHGLAVGDVDGDGLEDLYALQPGGLPNRLFVQRPDGTAVDVSSDSGVDYLNSSAAALLVDLDNDGDQDLAVTVGSSLTLHANDGRGRFEVRFRHAAPFAMSLASADYDNDGDLDLYAASYSPPESSAPTPFFDANNGAPNFLLRNDGGWNFSDATVETGLDENNRRYSFAAAWIDYDDDGDQDLYVANDFGRNNLYRNQGGRFTDAAAEAGVEDISAGMSVSWGDADNDGRADLYVGNMFSSAGKRTTYQRRFKETTDETSRRWYQRLARGNSLFRNAGDGTFLDVSEEAGVTLARWAWGSKFADINNDGWEDLFAVNGYVTNVETHDL